MLRTAQRKKDFVLTLNRRPQARAQMRGDAQHPQLRGTVSFYACSRGTVVLAELWGLPYDASPCAPNIFAMHLHAGGSCDGHDAMAFSDAGGHYNPDGCAHPAHAGDLPPLFGNRGYAWQGCYTERFTPQEVIGKTVIVHARRDDFTSQPAGDAGERIGCGVIEAAETVVDSSERE